MTRRLAVLDILQRFGPGNCVAVQHNRTDTVAVFVILRFPNCLPPDSQCFSYHQTNVLQRELLSKTPRESCSLSLLFYGYNIELYVSLILCSRTVVVIVVVVVAVVFVVVYCFLL